MVFSAIKKLNFEVNYNILDSFRENINVGKWITCSSICKNYNYYIKHEASLTYTGRQTLCPNRQDVELLMIKNYSTYEGLSKSS